MIAIAIYTLLGSLAAGICAAMLISRLPSLRLRAMVGLLIAALVPLIAVVGTGLAMVEAEHRSVVVAIVAGSLIVPIATAVILDRSFVRPLQQIQDVAARLSAGDMSARVKSTGASETDGLAGSFNAMASSLETHFDSRKQLIAWASHDLRTPIAATRAMLEAIEDGIGTADEFLPEIARQTDRLSNLVDNFFQLATIESSPAALKFDQLPLSQLMAGCLAGFSGQATANGVRVKSEVSNGTQIVSCSPDAIDTAVMNLVSNALKFANGSREVRVRAQVINNVLTISVSDDGPGLPPGNPEQLFQHFYRGDQSRNSPGTGLGLAITKGLVEAQGGYVTAENNSSGGATFSIHVPQQTRSN